MAFRRTLSLLCLALVPTLLPAQSYASQFSGETYDRSRGPATFHGSSVVDNATGAVHVEQPMGPGIGQRGIHFVPTLRGDVAPNLDAGITGSGGSIAVVALGATTVWPGFSLCPGFLDLAVGNASIGMNDDPPVVSNFTLPDGSSSSFLLSSPYPAPAPGPILGSFGYSSMSVGPGCYQADKGPGTRSFLGFESGGGFVIGLTGPDCPYAHAPNVTYGNNRKENLDTTDWNFPAKILVVRGDVAYEFGYQGAGYTRSTDTDALPAPVTMVLLRRAHYRLTAIVNRYGESVAFTYDAAGSDGYSRGYVATWNQAGAPTANTITLRGGTLTYAGPANAPSYQVAFTSYTNTYETGDGLYKITPKTVTCVPTDETVTFTFANLPMPDSGNASGTFAPLFQGAMGILQKIQYPNRTITYTWKGYLYVRNVTVPGAWTGYYGATSITVMPPYSGDIANPSWFWGVTQVDDQDLASGTVYTTVHNRKIPQAVYSTMAGQVITWAPTAFYDAVTNPDKSLTVYRFTEPLSGIQGGPADSVQNQMQTLAHLKHLVTEVRHYTSTNAGNALNELAGSASTAYRVELFDRWDLRNLGNPTGAFTCTAVPFPTRTRTYDVDTKVLTIQESTSWDATNLGWQATYMEAGVQESPALSRPEGSANVLGLAYTSTAPSYPTLSASACRVTNRTFSTDPANWFLGRTATEQMVNLKDGTGSYLPTNPALPISLPKTTRGYDAPSTGLSRTQSVTTAAGGSSVTTSYGYTGSAGALASGELNTVTISGSSDLVGPKVGVSQYLYDSLGFLRSIQPLGVAWTRQQSQDGFGIPQDQTDPNGNTTTYGWDLVGRLTSIAPPSSEVATSIVYNPDLRGAKVTRGAQATEYRYDGLGQLVLIKRWDSNAESHKVFQYDLLGRKLFESVWRCGAGTDTEGLAGGTDGDVTTYDGRGRPTSHTDANGIVTRFFYKGLAQTVTVGGTLSGDAVVGGISTVYLSDALGRLQQVTDALNQVTTYGYDAMDHMVQSSQTDSTVTGQTQTRTWGYHPMGWLASLVQPESGTTTYSGFTVTGKPSVTTYLGDGTSSQIVRTTFGALMRPEAVASDDGSVAQAFGYDGNLPSASTLAAGTYGAANDHLTYARDASVEEGYTFGGLNGRLSQMLTRVWVGTAAAGTTSHDFVQTFTCDASGNRNGGTTPGGTAVAVGWDLAKGLPNTVTYGSTPVVTATYHSCSWALTSLSGAGWLSQFTYDGDQARLHTLFHSNASQNVSWTYGYDPFNRMTSAEEQLNQFLPDDATYGTLDASDQFGYDDLNRLTSASVWNLDHSVRAVQTLGYDGFGNPTSVSTTAGAGVLPNPAQALWYNQNYFSMKSNEKVAQAAHNRLPATAGGVGTGVSYDFRGNLTKVFTQTLTSTSERDLTYDALGRVIQLTDSTRQVTENYRYSPEGLRTLIEVWQGPLLQSRMFNLYNDARQLVSQYAETLAGSTSTPVVMAVLKPTSRIKAQVVEKEPCDGWISAPADQTTVQVGQAVLFTGVITFGTNATWTFGDGGTGAGLSPSHTYTTAGTYTVTMRTTGPPATTLPDIDTRSIKVVPALGIGSFSASASAIPVGGTATISWSTTGATSVTLNGSAVALSGSMNVSPASSTTYTLKAANAATSVTSAPVTVNVVQAPAIGSFSASPGTLLAGATETLAWSASGATSLSISPGIGDVTGRTSYAWAASVPGTTPVGTTYTLTATNTAYGISVTRTAQAGVTVYPNPVLPAIVFTASTYTIGAGQSTTLSWNVTGGVGAVAVTLNGSSVPANSSQTVSPGTTTTYQLTATSTELDATVATSANVNITVVQLPVITSFTATLKDGSAWNNNININAGQTVTLKWTVANAPDSVSIDNGVGGEAASDSTNVVPPDSGTTYTLTASNLAGSAKPAQVVVSVTPKPVIASFIASPATIVSGRSTTLAWIVTGATSYTINGVAVTGTSAVTGPTATKVYTLTATNDSGSTSAQVTVTVVPAGALAWQRDILYLGAKEVAEVDAQGVHTTQVDHLGSPFYALGPNGAILGRQKFMPFGETLDQRGSLTIAKGFTDHEKTDASGLIYMQARFYMPQYHRFSSPDPVMDQHFEDPQSLNLYAYCENEPVMRIDPTGETNFLSFVKDAWSYIKGAANAAANGITKADKAVSNASKKVKEKVEKTANKLAGQGSITNGERHEKFDAAVKSGDTKSVITLSLLEMSDKFQMLPAGITPTGEPASLESPSINPAEVAGKSPAEIYKIATDSGLVPKGPDPMAGRGSYLDPVTGNQRVLIHPDGDSGPHAHVNNPAGERLSVQGAVVHPESSEAHLPLNN